MENITIGDIKNVMVILSTMITSGGIIAVFVYNLFKSLLKKELEPFTKKIEEQDEKRKEQHEETMQQIADLTRIVDFNDIDAVRNRIVAFENLCRLDVNNDSIKLHQYKTYFKDHDKWVDYHKKYKELNGEINTAIESINEHYKKAKF